MSERRVRLLYKTTCRACGDDVPAGTTTWWDDDRRQATCASCIVDVEPDLGRDASGNRAAGRRATSASRATVVAVDERLHRRHLVIRARRPRPAPRRTSGLGPRPTVGA